ncbi:MAG: hypothetical protein IKN52_10690, partial [Victivallales bacterium]|nr:hypothetical protein [Victivallales bacterium]
MNNGISDFFCVHPHTWAIRHHQRRFDLPFNITFDESIFTDFSLHKNEKNKKIFCIDISNIKK